MRIESASRARFAQIAVVALTLALQYSARSLAAEGRAPQAPTSPGPVTFNKDIAPLVFRHCASCHRPGEVAPFSLLNYHAVNKRAEQFLDVIERHVMPPWKPVAGYGEFSNGRRLTPGEISLVRRWVAEGAIEGNAQDLPPTPEFVAGWQLGQPDLVLTAAEPVRVSREGPDLYLNLVLPLKIPPGKYLKAVEFRPSNPRAVHHAVLYCDTSGKARERDQADPEPGFIAMTPPGNVLPGAFAIWAPGRNALMLGEGLSMSWPENGDLVVQLHLHPSGKPEVEQPSIGFHFTDQPSQRSLLHVTLVDNKIDIPAGEKAFPTHDSCVLPIDMEAVSIYPHMHMIGKEIKVTATLPDGTIQVLLWIDDWDFNLQNIYEFAEPVRLPRGTKLSLEGIHDNSAENPRNPKNPPQRVRWGEQTFDEMSIAFVNTLPIRESDIAELEAKLRQQKGP